MFNIDCVQSKSPPSKPQYYNPASNNVLGAEKLLNDDPKSEKNKVEDKSYYFRSSGLQFNMPATTAAVNQNVMSSTTPSVSVPQNADAAAVPPRKQKYSFGRTNNLNEEEEL